MWTLCTQWAFVIFQIDLRWKVSLNFNVAGLLVDLTCMIYISLWKVNHKLTSLTESYFNAGFPLESIWWQISTFIQWFFSEGVSNKDLEDFCCRDMIFHFVSSIFTEKLWMCRGNQMWNPLTLTFHRQTGNSIFHKTCVEPLMVYTYYFDALSSPGRGVSSNQPFMAHQIFFHIHVIYL